MRQRPKCLPRGFETTDIAERRRDRLIKVLQRDPERFATQIDLLYECNVRRGCGARICDICMRKTRLHLVREGCKHLGPLVRRRELIAVSIVLPNETGHVNRGPPDFRRLRARLKRRLERLPLAVPLLIAGLDVSLNEEGGRQFWQVQLYGVTHVNNTEALRDAFGRSESVEKPLQICTCTDLGAPLTYALKTQYVRRVSYRDRKGNAKTRKPWLSNSQRRVVARWLRDVGCWDTVFLVGLTRRGERLVPLRRRSKLLRGHKVPRKTRARSR